MSKALLLSGLVLSTVFVGFTVKSIFLDKPPLVILDEPTWGPQKLNDTSITPFKINVEDSVLVDLKNRLKNARYTPPLKGIEQQYGFNTNLLKELVEFWKTKYDWRKQEQYLNKFPQFTTNIQGLKIHYLHVKPKVAPNIKVLPLLIVHGWPGSVREFYEIIPHLVTPQPNRNFVFEVIAPSLPGYTFSEGTNLPGLNVGHMAVIMKNLMARIGHEQYYLQGGDWGSVVTATMAIMYPERALGYHSNMCMVQGPLSVLKTIVGSFFPSLIMDVQYKDRIYPYMDELKQKILETGYLHIQATKPDTVGVGLGDSPIGLAAYILEKFSTGTKRDYRQREDGGLRLSYDLASLIDNVMLYWITNSMTTAMRLYAESFSAEHRALGFSEQPILPPSACARFSNEITYQPDSILKERYVNLVQTTDYDVGGHFIAMEMPKIFAKDIYDAIEKMETYNAQKNTKSSTEL